MERFGLQAQPLLVQLLMALFLLIFLVWLLPFIVCAPALKLSARFLFPIILKFLCPESFFDDAEHSALPPPSPFCYTILRKG